MQRQEFLEKRVVGGYAYVEADLLNRLKIVANRIEMGLIPRMAIRHSDLRHDTTFTHYIYFDLKG